MKPILTFSKKVKNDDNSVVFKEITDSADISKLVHVIERLDTLPKVMTSNLDEIHLRTNPKKWISSLVKSFPGRVDKPVMENLLLDFIDSMKTRMREESKYALGLIMENKLALCHSVFGEETVTPEWKIIPRMLDTDNVLRYVSFTDIDGAIKANYWEREATSSFTEWLGLPRKQAFLFGGKYRICCEIDSITTELQLTEMEMKNWLAEHPEFRDGKIELSSPMKYLHVNEVRTGRKYYHNVGDFIQDYEAEMHGVPRYQKEYQRIIAEFLPLLMKYYDEKTQVVRVEGDEEVTEVSKSTPQFEILFANGNIEFRASYLAELTRRFLNRESIKIFHAGMKFRMPPFTLGSMEVYNQLHTCALTKHIIQYYNETNLQDANLDALFRYAVLNILEQANCNSPIASIFNSLSHEIIRELSLQGKLSKVEDKIIEYKSREILAGGNDQVIEKLSQDIRKKLNNSSCKLYIVGVEDDGTFDPFLASRLSSDRIETIRKGLCDNLGTTDIFSFPAVQKEKGVLLITAFHNNKTH